MKLDQRIVVLSNLLNEKMALLTDERSDLYYYILIEINNLADKFEGDGVSYKRSE